MTLTPKIFPTVMPSWGGSLANRFLSLAHGSPKKIPGGSGPNSSESFAHYDLGSSSWRTSQVSLLPEWETYSETWPRSGMTRNGRAYRLPRLVPHISAGVSSSSPIPTPTSNPGTTLTDFVWMFPTPSASEYGSNQSPSPGAAVRPSLSQMARSGMWPTPTVSDGMGGPGHSGRDGGENLRTAVRWATPTASQQNWSHKTEWNALPLHRQVGGQLNPTWVEWLMGFPQGWTDLEA